VFEHMCALDFASCGACRLFLGDQRLHVLDNLSKLLRDQTKLLRDQTKSGFAVLSRAGDALTGPVH